MTVCILKAMDSYLGYSLKLVYSNISVTELIVKVKTIIFIILVPLLKLDDLVNTQ